MGRGVLDEQRGPVDGRWYRLGALIMYFLNNVFTIIKSWNVWIH